MALVTRIALPFCLAVACLSAACGAAARPPETGTPRAGERSTSVVTLALNADRRDLVLDAWRTLLREQGIVTASNKAINNRSTADSGRATANNLPATLTPELQPVTRTIRRLPPALSSLRITSVGNAFDSRAAVNAVTSTTQSPQQEEAERESLRRFIADARTVLGVEPADVSLVRIESRRDATRSALYRQKPFLYPLRGGYGLITIDYTRDGRVLALNSTALPEARSVARLISALRPTLTADDALTRLAGKTFTVREEGTGGAQQRSLPADISQLRRRATVRELIIYPSPLAGAAAANSAQTNVATDLPNHSPTADATVTTDNTRDALAVETMPTATFALRLAWEVAVAPEGTEGAYMIYIDALSGETIAAAPATNS